MRGETENSRDVKTQFEKWSIYSVTIERGFGIAFELLIALPQEYLRIPLQMQLRSMISTQIRANTSPSRK